MYGVIGKSTTVFIHGGFGKDHIIGFPVIGRKGGVMLGHAGGNASGRKANFEQARIARIGIGVDFGMVFAFCGDERVKLISHCEPQYPAPGPLA